MQALLHAKQLGLTEQIGVSNFNIELTQQAIHSVGLEHIATNPNRTQPVFAKPKIGGLLTSTKNRCHVVHDLGVWQGVK